MALVKPKYVALDSSTLGKVSADFWSSNSSAREKARRFLDELINEGVYITVTFQHVAELIRHENDQTASDRLSFMRSLKLLAWLRPYSRAWFPGTIIDILKYEFHAVVRQGCESWSQIIESVRPTLWETGVGADMFTDDRPFWSVIRQESQKAQHHETRVASIARTDASKIGSTKVLANAQLPRRAKEDRNAYANWFSREMQRQLELHGDRRLSGTAHVVDQFVATLFADMKEIDSHDGDPYATVMARSGVPASMVNENTTVEEFGELVIYCRRLQQLNSQLVPPATATIIDLPPSTLPSYALERAIAAWQSKEDRVSGSNFGDSFIAPVALYCDFMEVDKRTFEYLSRIKRDDARFERLLDNVFKSSDYSAIPSKLR